LVLVASGQLAHNVLADHQANPVAPGQTLEPRGDVDRVGNDGCLHALSFADDAEHQLSAMDPHADLHRWCSRGNELLVELRHRLLHADRCLNRVVGGGGK